MSMARAACSRMAPGCAMHAVHHSELCITVSYASQRAMHHSELCTTVSYASQ